MLFFWEERLLMASVLGRTTPNLNINMTKIAKGLKLTPEELKTSSLNGFELLQQQALVLQNQWIRAVIPTRSWSPLFFSPTSCDACGNLLLGLWNQGYRCDGDNCGQTVCPDCVETIPDNCPLVRDEGKH
mmetsp:Transcript_11104/g.20950  ORF Transcript_11104/g.20950 Transcript_11104/m.20950 type:complete len:130 (+) Transcript_11104:121-510(+)